jgi:hypothetical protein
MGTRDRSSYGVAGQYSLEYGRKFHVFGNAVGGVVGGLADRVRAVDSFSNGDIVQGTTSSLLVTGTIWGVTSSTPHGLTIVGTIGLSTDMAPSRFGIDVQCIGTYSSSPSPMVILDAGY